MHATLYFYENHIFLTVDPIGTQFSGLLKKEFVVNRDVWYFLSFFVFDFPFSLKIFQIDRNHEFSTD